MLCLLLDQTTRCCTYLFQDFPFSLAIICALSFISKLNAGSILKGTVALPKSDAIVVAINKWINTNSNKAIRATQWEAVQMFFFVI